MSNVTVKKEANKELINTTEMKKYDSLTSIAAKIRYLLSLNKSKGDISRFMTDKEGKLVRYQWVRNVSLTPIKKAN